VCWSLLDSRSIIKLSVEGKFGRQSSDQRVQPLTKWGNHHHGGGGPWSVRCSSGPPELLKQGL
jgi:hypothetical protein